MKRTITASPLPVPRKIPRRRRSAAVRSLSDLPDDILCHILSLMPSKFAVQANVLSRRWRWLSYEVDDLDLDLDDFSRCRDLYRSDELAPGAMAALEDFVEGSVRRRDGRAIRSLRLSFSTLRHDHPAYDWVARAARGGLVQEFRLDISSESVDDHLELPDELFACPSLKSLRLSNMELLQPLSFAALRSLYLYKVGFGTELYKPPDDGVWDRREPWELLCPSLLEELTIDSCESDGPRLQINSSTLRYLSIQGSSCFDDIYVDAEKLQELQVRCRYGRYLYVSAGRLESLKWVQSLVEVVRFAPNSISASMRASISIPAITGDAATTWRSLVKLLHAVHPIRTLALNHLCMNLLSSHRCKSREVIPMFMNVRQLMLHTPMYDGSNKMVIKLLHKCPRLEVLVIKHTIFSCWVENDENHNPNKRLDHLPKELKKVEMLDFSCWENEFEIVCFLLQRFSSLEEMIVNVARHPCDAKLKFQARKLLDFPRASSRVKISIL